MKYSFAKIVRLMTGIAICAVLLQPETGFAQTGPAAAKTPPAVGTIKSIGDGTILLTNEAGTEVRIQVEGDVKFLRVPPGSKDLKDSTPIQMSDLQPGDRILVRGRQADDASTFIASTIISMKKEDLVAKQAKEREEWQRKGIGGLVKSVDAGAGVVSVGTMTAAGKKDVEVHASKTTIVRRYAPGSVKFDDAKPSSLPEIHPGDQLLARGSNSEDGASLTADEIVAGSFRNIAGTVVAVEASAGKITVTDLSNNKPVEVKITTESQVRKLPPPMAQRIAMRLKGATGDATAGNGGAGAKPEAAPNAGLGAGTGVKGQSSMTAGQGRNFGAGANGGGDLQQLLSRLPATPLGEFQKGDAVIIVATSGESDSTVVAIRLLGGVEPILQASSQGEAASILSPWSLSNGGNGDTGTP